MWIINLWGVQFIAALYLILLIYVMKQNRVSFIQEQFFQYKNWGPAKETCETFVQN